MMTILYDLLNHIFFFLSDATTTGSVPVVADAGVPTPTTEGVGGNGTTNANKAGAPTLYVLFVSKDEAFNQEIVKISSDFNMRGFVKTFPGYGFKFYGVLTVYLEDRGSFYVIKFPGHTAFLFPLDVKQPINSELYTAAAFMETKTLCLFFENINKLIDKEAIASALVSDNIEYMRGVARDPSHTVHVFLLREGSFSNCVCPLDAEFIFHDAADGWESEVA